MFPVLSTARDAALAAIAFARARPWLAVLVVLAYGVTALFSEQVLGRWHLPGNVGGYLSNAIGGLLALVLIAPVWTAVFRFIIVKDTSRGYYPFDVRVRRVLFTTLVLAVLAVLGGLPVNASLDATAQLVGRRSAVIAILAAAAVWKLAVWWLSCRLAIAPPLGAAGVRKEALDSSFAYTPGAVLRIMALKVVVYIPAFLIIGLIIIAGRLPFIQRDLTIQPWAVGLGVLITAASDLVDACAMGRVALILVRLRNAPRTSVDL